MPEENQQNAEQSSTVTITLCNWCSSEEVLNCKKCNKPYCSLHASRWSPLFCQDCFGGNGKLKVIEDRFVRTVEDYDFVNETLVQRKQDCRRLRMDGEDWVFITKWINSLSDEELESVLEFHFFTIKQIEIANETRQVKRKDALKDKKVKGMGIVTTTETKTRKVKAQVDLATMLRKQFPNMPQAVIDQMVIAAKTAQGGS